MADYSKKEIKIIYEDEALLIIDKLAGWVTTKESGQLSVTSCQYVEDWVKKFWPNDLPRGGIVHRLDKGTSGVLVIAKTKESMLNIKKQFKQRQTKKHYWALAGGDLPLVGNIKVPIIRSKYTFGKFKVGEEGRVAETEFRRIKKIKINGLIYSLVDVNLKTGRTHQIRVHLSYMGWPILGDSNYGGTKIDGLTRPFLHAYEIEIVCPTSNKVIKFNSLLPTDLKGILKKYET